MITNLDIAKKYFKYARFDENDSYKLGNEYSITWLGEYEEFVVDRYFFDPDVGYVSSPDMFAGDFRQCLEFCLGHKLDAVDVAALEKIKAG